MTFGCRLTIALKGSVFNAILVASLCAFSGCAEQNEITALKDFFHSQFFMGAALNADQFTGKDLKAKAIIKKHFNSIVAENCMKSINLQPEEGKFYFDEADRFVEFGEKNNMLIIGHTLIWHRQVPPWLFVDDNGQDVTREVLIHRMQNHIHTVVSRYRGRVHGWDVVNEAILDDGSWRNTKWYQIIGKDYLQLAFEFAHKADPDAELYYNDYSMSMPGRRSGIVEMILDLQEKGIRIDGVGMQCHHSLDSPDLQDMSESIEAFSALGINVMITEMDITVLPHPPATGSFELAEEHTQDREYNPYTKGIPDSIQTALTNRYTDLFRLFLEHSDVISRVTLWGVHDGQSWKNNWPVHARTDYPLLFDRMYMPKPAMRSILEMKKD